MTTSQKRGALLLLAILVALAGWRWRVATLAEAKEMPDVEDATLALDREEQKQNQRQRQAPIKRAGEPVPRKKVYVELNSSTAEELQTVKGIGPVFAERIVKYRKMRHGFSHKEQLKEVYGIEDEQYAGIGPQVYVDTTSTGFLALQKPKTSNPRGEERENEVPKDKFQDIAVEENKPLPQVTSPLNINLADSAALDQIPGIGPSTASNIVKYRNLIFYFHSPTQLDEVWGIRPENKEKMLPFLLFDEEKAAFSHLNINIDSKDELARHKYLGFKEAGILVAYREHHGDFSSPEDLRQVLGLKPETLARITPYLRF